MVTPFYLLNVLSAAWIMNAFYLFTSRTVGICGPFNLEEQVYDYNEACPTCGKGAEPVEPLLVDLTEMRGRHLRFTGYDGFLIVSKSIAEKLASSKLTGFSIETVTHYKKTTPSTDYCWVKIKAPFPSFMLLTSQVNRSDLCPQCQHSGYCDILQSATVLHYPNGLLLEQDFYYTQEKWGIWNVSPEHTAHPKIGGAQRILVSEQARHFLSSLSVKRLRFQPVQFVEGGEGG